MRRWNIRNNLIFLSTFIFFYLLFFLEATEHKPWLGKDFEFEWENTLIYQNYSKISTGFHNEHKKANDFFFDTSLRNAFFGYGIEIEGIVACTKRQKGNIDCLRATGRYVLMDDVAGDSYSMTLGLSLSKPFWKSLTDLSSFHHGLYEMDCFFSFGKELECHYRDWKKRFWIVSGLGIAERGLPWLYFQGNYEFRFDKNHALRLLVEGLAGFGNNRLHLHSFKGYGLIEHRSCDLGIQYTYFTEVDGYLELSYKFRPYAHNFPAYTNLFTLSYIYPFGL